jgi:hypothetical protein
VDWVPKKKAAMVEVCRLLAARAKVLAMPMLEERLSSRVVPPRGALVARSI